MTFPGLEITILKFHDFSRFSMAVRTLQYKTGKNERSWTTTQTTSLLWAPTPRSLARSTTLTLSCSWRDARCSQTTVFPKLFYLNSLISRAEWKRQLERNLPPEPWDSTPHREGSISTESPESTSLSSAYVLVWAGMEEQKNQPRPHSEKRSLFPCFISLKLYLKPTCFAFYLLAHL